METQENDRPNTKRSLSSLEVSNIGLAAVGACGLVAGATEAIVGVNAGDVLGTLGASAVILYVSGPQAMRDLRHVLPFGQDRSE